MELFDNKGMMIIPNPVAERAEMDKALVAVALYCQHGHSLMSKRAIFNGHPGIKLRVKQHGDTGIVAFSPIFGEKTRVALDIDLRPGERAELFCPVCDIKLPVHSPCPCGGEIIALFRNPHGDFSECFGLCDMIDCNMGGLIQDGELVHISMLEE